MEFQKEYDENVCYVWKRENWLKMGKREEINFIIEEIGKERNMIVRPQPARVLIDR